MSSAAWNMANPFVDICNYFGVRHMDMIEFLRIEKARFVLDGNARLKGQRITSCCACSRRAGKVVKVALLHESVASLRWHFLEGTTAASASLTLSWLPSLREGLCHDAESMPSVLFMLDGCMCSYLILLKYTLVMYI